MSNFSKQPEISPTQQLAWKNFESTGSISAYLSYKVTEKSGEEISDNADYDQWYRPPGEATK